MEKLKSFLDKHKYVPEQRSAEWYANRKYTIGGSEMAVIAGCNPYKKIRDLVENHLGIKTFNGNINTYWGTVLEDIAIHILEKELHCKIHETGSLPGAVVYQKFSPDGLVYLEHLDKVALIEIKNGARRIPNGRVPAHYKPQIFAGLDSIKVADFALFVDVMFRRCSLKDFAFNTKFDTEIHPDKPVDDPMALCLMHIYGDSKGYIDAGSCNKETLEGILKKLAEGEYTCKYEVSHSKAPKVKKSKKLVAVLPLKLFDMEIIPVDRDEWKKTYNRATRKWEIAEEKKGMYSKQHEKTIFQTVELIKKLSNLSREEQLRELEELYPSDDVPEYIYDDLLKSMLNHKPIV